MTKSEFINKIKSKLSNFPENIVDDRLSFYTEMIDDYIDEGMTEVEACEKLGSIDEIVESIAGDIPLKDIAKKKLEKRRRLSALEIVLLIVGFPIWFSLIAVCVSVLITLYVALWSIVISLWSVAISCGVSFIGSTILFIINLCNGNQSIGFCYLGLSFILLGISCLFVLLSKYLTVIIVKVPKFFFKWIKSFFIIKEDKNEENN